MDYNSFLLHLKKIYNNTDIKFYFVGGIVRDKLLNIKYNQDIDIVVEYEFEKFVELFMKYFNIEKKTVSPFLTTHFIIDTLSIDIITARKEIYEESGKLPKIIRASIKDDLLRRDFTINSIAFDIRTERYMDILSGIEDIKKKIIRENRKNLFVEDPTRIFRLFKYKNRFNFSIEKNTLNDLQNNLLNKNIFYNVSKSRISREWLLILKEREYKKIIEDLYENRVFELLFNKSINIELNYDFENLNNYEKTLLIFWNNDFDVLVNILDILLNGIKKTHIKKIKTIKDYLRKNITINNKLKIEYENILKNILT